MPPDPQFFVLKDNDPKFRATWEGRRPDLSGQTASHYDMSIASIALATGWSDQQVVDTIIARRRFHGQELKLRESYYVTTIKKAKHPIRAQHAQDTLDEALESKEPNRNDVIRESLTTLFGVEIRRIVKYLGDRPIYWMSTAQGDITLGQISSITSQQNFRNLVAAATNVIIPKCPPGQWDKRAQAILNACQHVSLGDASHPAEETREWLRGYLSQKPPVDDRDQAASANAPFTMARIHLLLPRPLQKTRRVRGRHKNQSHRHGKATQAMPHRAGDRPCQRHPREDHQELLENQPRGPGPQQRIGNPEQPVTAGRHP